jgi:hypothetical protein
MNKDLVEFYVTQILLMNRKMNLMQLLNRKFVYFSHRFVLMTMINRSLSDQVRSKETELIGIDNIFCLAIDRHC